MDSTSARSKMRDDHHILGWLLAQKQWDLWVVELFGRVAARRKMILTVPTVLGQEVNPTHALTRT